MNKRRGYSLTEILVTVVILAAIAGVAIPGFTKARNKAAANQAIAYLRTIRTSQKWYYAKWRTYLDAGATIKDDLGAETSATKDYDFSVSSPGQHTTFTATATKKDGSGEITLTENGNFTANGTQANYAPAAQDS